MTAVAPAGTPGYVGKTPTIPSGETRPFVSSADAGMTGSIVTGAPTAADRAVPPAPVVQSSIFVVGLAFDWSQYTASPSTYARFGALLLKVVIVRASTGTRAIEASPPSPVEVLGPAGIVAAVFTVATTCSMRSLTPTLMEGPDVVHPVNEVTATPVHVMTSAALGVGVCVRSTNGPGNNSSGDVGTPPTRSLDSVWSTEMVDDVADTVSVVVANESASRPTCSVAGTLARGLA